MQLCHFFLAKKMRSGYNIVSLADSQNVRSSNVLLTPMLQPHTFLLLIPSNRSKGTTILTLSPHSFI